jgi:RND family efflux transporter MFP subunit
MKTLYEMVSEGFSWLWRHKVASVILIAVLWGGYSWWQSSHAATGQVQYVTAAAEKGMIAASISGSGNVIVDSQANIDPTITGTVVNLAVSVGDSVKKGQLLFMIDNDQLDINVAQAQSSLANAEVSVAQAQTSLYNAKNGGSETERDRGILQRKITIAEQSLVASRLSYAKVLSDASKRRVTSPIDGTVNEINIKNGDDLANISSGSSRVTPMIIGDLSTMKVSIAVNEIDIAKVAIGQKATVRLSALGGLTLTGKVEKLDSLGTITQGVVTYSATIGFDAPDARVRPGMSVSASIIYDVKTDILTVPNSAVKSDTNGSYVQIMNGAVPERKSVEAGLSNSTSTEITSGLSAGDTVVTKMVNSNAASTTGASGTGSGLRLPGLGGGMH